MRSGWEGRVRGWRRRRRRRLGSPGIQEGIEVGKIAGNGAVAAVESERRCDLSAGWWVAVGRWNTKERGPE